jgi:predicted YcjX-like family ATPase
MQKFFRYHIKRIENILWYIDTNKNVLSDKEILDNVKKALQDLINEYEEILEKLKEVKP